MIFALYIRVNPTMRQIRPSRIICPFSLVVNFGIFGIFVMVRMMVQFSERKLDTDEHGKHGKNKRKLCAQPMDCPQSALSVSH